MAYYTAGLRASGSDGDVGKDKPVEQGQVGAEDRRDLVWCPRIKGGGGGRPGSTELRMVSPKLGDGDLRCTGVYRVPEVHNGPWDAGRRKILYNEYLYIGGHHTHFLTPRSGCARVGGMARLARVVVPGMPPYVYLRGRYT